jgi:hypothetical protein
MDEIQDDFGARREIGVETVKNAASIILGRTLEQNSVDSGQAIRSGSEVGISGASSQACRSDWLSQGKNGESSTGKSSISVPQSAATDKRVSQMNASLANSETISLNSISTWADISR